MSAPFTKIWEELFTQHQLSTKMRDIATKPNGSTFTVQGHGTVRVSAMKISVVGDNYMSDAYSVKIFTSDNTEHSAFVKVLPTNPVLREGAHLFKVYDREVVAYSELIPRIEEFKRLKGITNDQVPIAIPRAHYVFLDEVVKGERDGLGTVIVLEDLKLTGHKTANKKLGCDYHSARLTLQALANYHAASIAYVRQYFQENELRNFPRELKILQEDTIFSEKCPGVTRAATPLHVSILKDHQMHEDAAWVEMQLSDLENVVFQEKLEDCGSLPGILHGDMWINNIMYRYENDEVVAATLVDWQLVRFGHPATDLVYFLFTSTTCETRTKHLDQLLEHYYSTLTHKLTLFGINIENEGYSLEKFVQDVQKRYVWGMFRAFVVLPMILDVEVVGKLREYESEDYKGLLGSSAPDVTAKREQKFKKLYTTSLLLKNHLLCERITKMVQEVRRVVSKEK